MNLNLEELCQLWRYQNTECRLTELLKEKIPGYDNNNPYSVRKATQDREQWMENNKFAKNINDLLDKEK